MKFNLVKQQQVEIAVSMKMEPHQTNKLGITMSCVMAAEQELVKEELPTSDSTATRSGFLSNLVNAFQLKKAKPSDPVPPAQAKPEETVKVQLSLELEDVLHQDYKHGKIRGSLKLRSNLPCKALDTLLQEGSLGEAGNSLIMVQVKIGVVGNDACASVLEFPAKDIKAMREEQECNGEDHHEEQESNGEELDEEQEDNGEEHDEAQESTGEELDEEQEDNGEEHDEAQEGTGEEHEEAQIYRYEVKEVSVPASLLQPPLKTTFSGLISLKILIPNKPTGIDSIGKQMLEARKFTDISLITQAGTEIRAHKVMLAGKSPILDNLIERTDYVEFAEKSDQVVEALLKYFYYGDILDAIQSSWMAEELFRAGQEYRIVALEQEMRSLLLDKPANWISIDVAVKLFVSAVKRDKVDNELKQRALEVILQTEENVLSSCLEFKNLENENAKELALGFFNLMKH